MTHYSDIPGSVRVDFFKPSGKWYATEAVMWTGDYDGDIHTAFAKSLRDHLCGRYADLDAVCLHPYHKHSHPITCKQGAWQ